MEQTKKKRVVTTEQALLKLMRSCSVGEKSTGDARRLLRRWEIDSYDSEKILERLVAEKYIDDNRFVELYIKDKLNFSGWGVRKIEAMLMEKGISRDVISENIAKVDRKSNCSKLEDILQKKYKSISKTESEKYKLRDKLIRFAVSRGYEFDQIFNIVEKIVK